MSVNAFGFYFCAALVVVAAITVVATPTVRQAAVACFALALATALLLVITGAYLLAVGQLVLALLLAGAVRWLLQHGEGEGFTEQANGWVSWWPLVTAIVGGGAAALIVVVVSQHSGWHQGTSSTNLTSLLHWRFPFGTAAAVVLLVLGGIGGWLIGNVSSDESELEETIAEKKQREERMARRRADRAAARQRRREGRAQS